MELIKRNKKINIIPLGQNCMPRTILTRQKVKPSKLFGEKTYPFDLAVFGMPEITKSLERDFNEFFWDLEYKDGKWIKAPNCIEFSRDTQCKQNDSDKLIALYKNRIENFRAAMQSPVPVLFVQILGIDEDIENQYKAIKRLRNDFPFKFAVVDTNNIVKEMDNPDISILKLNYPSEEYKKYWWKKEYYNSKEGKLFESLIAKFCINNIEELQKREF